MDRIFTDDLGWMFTPNEVREYGIDGHAQAVRDDGLVTGRLLATQVKGGASRFRRPAADGSGWAFWSDSKHLHYWLGYHVPVLVVLVRPSDGAAFWQVIRLAQTAKSLRRARRGPGQGGDRDSAGGNSPGAGTSGGGREASEAGREQG